MDNYKEVMEDMVQSGKAVRKIADELKNNGLNIGVLNCSSPLEIDEEAIVQAANTGLVVTYEDHNVKSGVAGVISKIILEKDISCKFLAKGISKYGASASPDKLYKDQGLDEESMIQEIKRVLSFS